MRSKIFSLALLCSIACQAQVYSPVVTKEGQVDASSVQSLVRDIYKNSGAVTPAERAEAIWHFFLTDGRFVKPGFWYHIAGWAYEEPKGEVLDAVKLLNSYGFGLCYHIAPLLEAVYDAGGFADARVWFLTGHTVAEVFYDGSYHYLDSDMMGYNKIGPEPLQQRRIASVRDIEKNGAVILDSLISAKKADPAKTVQPWYPADVRAGAVGELTALFTTAADNSVFPFKRYSEGHSMDFVLRPGERLTRYFRPAADHLYYLPFRQDGAQTQEFPKELKEFDIKTFNGPRSQKDSRAWGTGQIEYRPPKTDSPSFTIDMPCPYVIVDAVFRLDVTLRASDTLTVQTSTDGGLTWSLAETLEGPHQGPWQTVPRILTESAHGKHTAVSGSYGYQVKFQSASASYRNIVLTTNFQLNPRTLPELISGHNILKVRSGEALRKELVVTPQQFERTAIKVVNAEYVAQDGQGFIRNTAAGPGAIEFKLKSPDGHPLSGFDIGGRFLDLRRGLAPDKLTAEVRNVEPWPAIGSTPTASLAWSPRAGGPWTTVWTYEPNITWKDGDAITHTLLWPEVDKQVRDLPRALPEVYVRYAFNGIAIDDVRLAYLQSNLRPTQGTITHVWQENGVEKRRVEPVAKGERSYTIDIPPGAKVQNTAVILECPAPAPPQP